MKVAIVGAGNAGYSHAYKLAEKGYSVRLLKTSASMHDQSFDQVCRQGGIHAVDDTNGGKEGFQKLEMATRDPEAAIRGAEVILVVTQSLWHERVANIVCPHMDAARLVIVAPGYLGSVYFRQHAANSRNTIYAEGESLPFDARIIENGKVQILFRNVRNPLGIMPSKKREEGLRLARELFDNYTLRDSIVESALHNPNLIVHTIGTIMSAPRIEYSGGEFWMYREAFTPSSWNLVADLDAEKLALLHAFNLPGQSFAHSFQLRTFEDLSEDPMVAFKNYAAVGSPKGPGVVDHRYIYEDVPMGLCLMGSLGRAVGLKMPLSESLTHIASSLLQRDFFAQGRTLESLGLSHLDADGLKRYFID